MKRRIGEQRLSLRPDRLLERGHLGVVVDQVLDRDTAIVADRLVERDGGAAETLPAAASGELPEAPTGR